MTRKAMTATPEHGVAATEALSGQVVHEVSPAVLDYVTDESTGVTDTIVVSPPVYEPVIAQVRVFGAGPGASTRLVTSVFTDADGRFGIAGLLEDVSIEVVPPKDWQGGWLWAEYLAQDPGFASYLQWSAPPTLDITPPRSLGLIQLQVSWAAGSVVDHATGRPVAGATVHYAPVQHGFKPRSGKTNALGRFRLEGLDYEEYHVTMSAPGYLGGVVGAGGLLHPKDGWGVVSCPAGELWPVRMVAR